MTSLETIKDWLDNVYNDYVSIYIDESDGAVRITNGSGAHYVDITPENDELVLTGERYGDVVDETCRDDEKALIAALDSII